MVIIFLMDNVVDNDNTSNTTREVADKQYQNISDVIMALAFNLL